MGFTQKFQDIFVHANLRLEDQVSNKVGIIVDTCYGW